MSTNSELLRQMADILFKMADEQDRRDADRRRMREISAGIRGNGFPTDLLPADLSIAMQTWDE